MEKVKISEEYLMNVKASIVDSSNDFIGIADTEGNLIYLNDAAYAMMGYGPDERPEFKSIAEVHANDFDKFALEEVQPAVFKDGFWSGEGCMHYKGGGAVKVAQTVFPVVGEDGAMYGTAAVMRDISDINAVNEKLRENSELFQKVLDSSKIGIVLINMETNTIEMVNKFTQQLLQMSAEEIVGQKCYDVLCHRSLDICPHVNERDIDTIVAERFIERKDGTTIPIIKSGTWITLDDKEYLVDTFADISIQKELEKNLMDAKITAEAANRSKSEFLSRMSHEMRTPLNAVIGMTQIAGRADDVQKLKDAIHTIEVSSMHLLGIINDVLDLSKIEEGKLELSIESFSLSVMVQKIVSLMDSKAEEKNIHFNVDIDTAIPDMLVGDSMRLSQVLLNFLSNAFKFTQEKGGVTFSVKLQKLENGAADILFAVEDTGIGIAEDQLERLFNPFVQADGSISRKFGGTGLGLVISKRILNLMDSDVKVESKYGEGTRFSFPLRLPLSTEEQLETGKFDMGAIEGVFAGKRMLIVDDLDINRLIAAELLAPTGIEADEAADGLEAVQKVAESNYDILLMDVQMPVMDGYEATRQIREMEGPKKDTPIVAMSANVFKEDVERSMETGMDGHIGKPIDLATAVSLMAGLLENGRTDAGQEEQSTFEALHAAMEKGENERAQALAKRLQVEATGTQGVASYAGQVYECLQRGDYDYAKMYMADLVKAYAREGRK